MNEQTTGYTTPACHKCDDHHSKYVKQWQGNRTFCNLTGRDVSQSKFGLNSPRDCPKRIIRTPIILNLRKPVTMDEFVGWNSVWVKGDKDVKWGNSGVGQMDYKPRDDYLRLVVSGGHHRYGSGKYAAYEYNTITLIAQNSTLHIKFAGYQKQPKYLVIHGFKHYNALSILRVHTDMGRHFEDGIHKVYHTMGLPLGYVHTIFKE